MLNKLLLLVNLLVIVNGGVNNSPTYDPYQKTIDCTVGKTATDVCDITLVVEALSSMTYYNISSSYRELRGYRAAFNSAGNIVTLLQEPGIPDRESLLPPIQTDGCFRPLIAINGQMPGPTIVAHSNQTLNITVYNELKNVEGVTVHWHGMHQRGTQGADGAAYITQRPIAPQNQFTYTFRAYPSGTFWYHAHSGAQRTDGLYGALIIKDTIPGNLYDDDLPDQHTLIFMDWQKEASINQYYPEANAMEYFKESPNFDPPFQLYNDTRSSDETQVGFAPFWSAIINDKGRRFDEEGKTNIRPESLNYFRVSQGRRYRFRLIGAQGVYPFRFSIQNHTMTVIATDGSPIVPIENVIYVIVNTGERYDVVVNANSDVPGNFWIWAETLEDTNLSRNEVFYSPISLHRAEAILQYRGVGMSIAEIDQLRTCTLSTCLAVNCPFQQYGRDIRCINADQFKSLADHVIPQSVFSPDVTLFYNFGDDGETSTERDALDGINFRFPANPPLTEYAAFQRSGARCPNTRGCDHDTESFCSCTQVVDISNQPRGSVVEMVLTNRAVERDSPDGTSHPVHLHGHHFYVVKIGYPEYDDAGKFQIVNDDIECVSQSNDPCPENFITVQDQISNPMRQVVRWTNMSRPSKIDDKNRRYARKDTVIVPFGGYTVVRFIVDNPGWWFFHCHIEIHQLEGMSAVVRELPDELPPEFSNNGENTDMPSTCQPCSNFTTTGASQSDLKRSSITIIATLTVILAAIFV